MTGAERDALMEIQGLAGANRIRLEGHAHTRMRQRGAFYGDVRHALMTATECRDQRVDPDRRADWKVVGGCDLDGDALTCAVNLDGGVVVVTIF